MNHFTFCQRTVGENKLGEMWECLGSAVVGHHNDV